MSIEDVRRDELAHARALDAHSETAATPWWRAYIVKAKGRDFVRHEDFEAEDATSATRHAEKLLKRGEAVDQIAGIVP